MSYNDWTNYETWLVNNWYKPKSKEDVQYAKNNLEEQYYSISYGPLKAMINLRAIDWKELEGQFEDNDEEESEDE